MRIAILTFHRAYNCGAMLQAWALKTVLERMGHGVVFIDTNNVGEGFEFPTLTGKGILDAVRAFYRWGRDLFLSNFILLRRHLAFRRFRRKWMRDVNPLHSHFDLAIVGSDQVWNPACTGQGDFEVFLGNAKRLDCPYIGYAISCGDNPVEDARFSEIKEAVRHNFRRLSFRERFLPDALGLNAQLVCDPTLLLNRDEYRAIEHKRRIVKDKYLFVYVVNGADEVLKVSREISRRLGLKLVSVDVYRGYRDKRIDVPNSYWVFTPDMFVTCIRDAEYVISSSFHGCVFSVLYNKKFIYVHGRDSGGETGRQYGLLKAAGLLDRRFAASSGMDEMVAKLKQSYEVGDQLRSFAEGSLAWLKESL